MIDRRDLRRKLFARATGQGGHFSAAQAKEIGYSYQSQAHHVNVGNWLRVDRGIFRLAEWVPEPHDELSRWALWSREQGVISHETALSVHGFGELESPRIHLTVPAGFRSKHQKVRLHHADLPEGDVLRHSGFRMTTAVRSLVDVAMCGADEDHLARAVAEAADRGLLTLRQLRSRAEAVDAGAALRIERAISA